MRWAKSRGMAFGPEKSELIHFNKGRKQWDRALVLDLPSGNGFSMIRPVKSARFLGAWLDWKLSWTAHKAKIEEKLQTQEFALSRIAAKTWGPGLIRAREVYTKCIRSAIAYGASCYHTPTPPGGQPRGLAKDLQKAQARNLRIVAGAYKRTPIRNLETETWVPPLDLYLNKRFADFEQRLQTPSLRSGLGPGAPRKTPGSIVQDACNIISRRFLRRTRRPRHKPRSQGSTELEEAQKVIKQWVEGAPTTEIAMKKAWETRWKQSFEGRTSSRLADYDPPDFLFTNKALRKHQNLTKAQSSLLIQARTGVIGLRDFLFKIGVPTVPTPYCSCGEDKETVEHLVVWCSDPPKPRTWQARLISSHLDLRFVLRATGSKAAGLARKVIGWLMESGRLPEYRLAVQLDPAG